MRKTGKKYNCVYFLSIPKTAEMRKFLQQLLHKHSRHSLTVPCPSCPVLQHIPFSEMLLSPFTSMYNKSLLHHCHCT